MLAVDPRTTAEHYLAALSAADVDAVVDLVADGRHDGDGAFVDCPADDFLVKAPEILRTAAAPGDHHQVE